MMNKCVTNCLICKNYFNPKPGAVPFITMDTMITKLGELNLCKINANKVWRINY